MQILYSKLFFSSVLVVVSFFAITLPAHAAPAGFTTEVITNGLHLPTTVAYAPDGRIFIAEKGGTVQIVKNGALLPTPFITLTDVNQIADHGLLGLALDPNFATNGFVYLSYTFENTPGTNFNGPKTGRIVRVKANVDVADMSTYTILVGSIGGDIDHPSCSNFATSSDCLPSDSPSHSVGGLRFGPDGKLYASIGDGAGFFAVDDRARLSLDLDSLAGKMLRLNTDGTAPSDNPFYDGNPHSNRSKIYFYGIRNSFRFNFRPTNNSLYFGDVGWYTWEEINIGRRGANYGWPCREGNEAQAEYNCTTSAYTDPIYTILHHDSVPVAIVGGAFASSTYPAEYRDNYFFGDFGSGIIYRMVLNPNDSIVSTEVFTSDARGPVEIVTAPDGNINYLSIYTGELRRLVYGVTSTPTSTPPDNNPPPTATTTNALPYFISTTATSDIVSSSPVVGEMATVNTVIGNKGTADPFIVDIEIFNASSTQVAQLVVDPATIPANGQKTFQLKWLAEQPGAYRVAVGLIRPQWSSIIEWTNEAAKFTVLNRRPINSAPFTLTQGASDFTSPPTLGQSTAVHTNILNSGDAGDAVIDFEFFDATGNRVAQQLLENTHFANSETKSLSVPWTPPQTGSYRVAIGLFANDWSKLYHWENNALTAMVTDGNSTSTIIYDDALAAGWENWSWDTTVNFGTTMNITFKAPWAGLYIHHTAFDLINKTNLKFAMYSNNPNTQQLQVLLFDQNGQALPPVAIQNNVAATWQQITIPLSQLKGSVTKITGLAIQGNNAATFQLDTITLE